MPAEIALKSTALNAAHRAQGARMVPFAGYDMPVQYDTGIIAEHNWTREKAGLFDVSHMGQAVIEGPNFDTIALALETLVPADMLGLKPGQQRYTQLLNDEGGIIDDLMVARPAAADEAHLVYLVVNAATKDGDFALISSRLPKGLRLLRRDDRALLALQGPRAVDVMRALGCGAVELSFMRTGWFDVAGLRCHISRSGYTGEDGFEISVADDEAQRLWAILTAEEDVRPIGLGARDTLRLEAGLCLYGHDIDETTSPIEAGLAFSIQKRRREEGGFPGTDRIRKELSDGPTRKRVGLLVEGKAPAREGSAIVDAAGTTIGTLTSGSFGPTIARPIAMGYVPAAFAAIGTALSLKIRDRLVPASVAAMPFTPHRYAR